MATRDRNRNTPDRQKGTALVEFAIVAPLMLFLLLGVAEFGHALNQYNTLTKAVRDGARYVAGKALDGGTNVVMLPDSLKAETRQLVVNGAAGGGALLPGFSVANVTVSQVDAQHVSVQASYAYTPLLGAGASLPTFGLGGGGSIPLNFTFQASAVMRAL
jgi:hypothetical protein